MFEKILIANRGEIACRVIKTARKMGIKTVAIYSDADRQALHVQMADEAVHIGPSPANQSYIVIENVMKAIASSGAQAVHPGYGFLSENSRFAQALAAANVAFIGPPVAAIEQMGDKITSKKIAQEAGVSTVPGYMGLINDAEEAVKISQQIGYPVMIKASAGGGGKGMRIVHNAAAFPKEFESARAEAEKAFGDGRVYIEKYIEQPRHIEFQLLGDEHGKVIHLGERDCSVQRRHQKLIEESPSPFLTPKLREEMGKVSVRLAETIGYQNAGTIEFLVDKHGKYYFMEMNTRIQVEHGVTEEVTDIDLVRRQILIACGEKLELSQKDIKMTGHAIECRINAENPKTFVPSPGEIKRYHVPGGPGVRIDSHCYAGYRVPPNYDSMIGKLITYGVTRESAMARMRIALSEMAIDGIQTNIPLQRRILDDATFVAGEHHIHYLGQMLERGEG
ncbi:MAG TPA: acetyl-CoA carboxylase biotin carboxylase subunit [Rhodobacteraceae bacterium]|nr:acetyl-CoA carboxylase biotin carboxylase subunit [Paracoccaceae bacterium]